uniref:Ribosomal protein L7Ae/L30e/S12e/Gadd45 domain-containing protein n=1 Tax=Acrobeloides nanus TaxID=290746 RepID=A0A914DTK5_9BILA
MGKRKESKSEIKEELDETAATIDTSGVQVLEGPTTEKGEYDELCEHVNAISQPLANRKLAKKLYKLIKKASKEKKNLVQGLSDVQRAVRKDEKGIMVLAGNVSPIDIYSHIPALCEEKEIPYVFTPSREHLGLAAGHRRPSVLMMIKPSDDYIDLYNEVSEVVNRLVPEVVQ